MELTVVGCWAPYPMPGEACSAYLIRSGSANLLLDCGHGAMSRLPFYCLPEQLDGVVISHFHPDHCSDLPALRHYLRGLKFLGQDKPPLPVWMPEAGEERAKWDHAPEFTVMNTEGSARVGDLQLSFYPGRHPLPSYMVRVDDGATSLFYTADTAFFPEAVAASSGCDILLAECTLPPEEEHLAAGMGHLTWEQCGRWGTLSGCRVLVAGHLWPQYDRRQIEQVVVAAGPMEVRMARQGLTVGEIQ